MGICLLLYNFTQVFYNPTKGWATGWHDKEIQTNQLSGLKGALGSFEEEIFYPEEKDFD